VGTDQPYLDMVGFFFLAGGLPQDNMTAGAGHATPAITSFGNLLICTNFRYTPGLPTQDLRGSLLHAAREKNLIPFPSGSGFLAFIISTNDIHKTRCFHPRKMGTGCDEWRFPCGGFAYHDETFASVLNDIHGGVLTT